MDLVFQIIGFGIVYFLVFLSSASGIIGQAEERGRRGFTWSLLALVIGPLAFLVLWSQPRLQPPMRDLYVEVWRMGVMQAEEAVLLYYTHREMYEDLDPNLRSIAEDAISHGRGTPASIMRVLEQRTRIKEFMPSKNHGAFVGSLAEDLGMDAADAREKATATLNDPIGAMYYGKI